MFLRKDQSDISSKESLLKEFYSAIRRKALNKWFLRQYFMLKSVTNENFPDDTFN
jgi:hypothetical protein